MNQKKAKKLKKLARVIGFNQPPGKINTIYKRLKNIHKSNKGER